MGLISLFMMFIISLFGLVASGMLITKYNENYEVNKKTTQYKFNIFLLVFFILAVLGTIIAGAFGMKSSSAPVMTTTQVAAAPAPAPAPAASSSAANNGIVKQIPLQIK